MPAEKNDLKNAPPAEMPVMVPASRSWADIAFGIVSTLVATAFGAYIGKNIGGWGDRPKEVYDGVEKAASYVSSNIFAAIMAIFSGSLAAHANLIRPTKAGQEKPPAVTEKAESKSDNTKPVSADNQPMPNATIAGATLHEGQVTAEGQKRAM